MLTAIEQPRGDCVHMGNELVVLDLARQISRPCSPTASSSRTKRAHCACLGDQYGEHQGPA